MRWSVLILLGIFLISFASATIPGGCEDSMVAYWKMDGDATDSYHGNYDGSGGFFDGTVLKAGTASKFRGSDKITVSNLAASHFGSAFMIEMWIKEIIIESNALLFDKGDYKIEYVLEGSAPFVNHYIRASVGSVELSSGNLNVDTSYHIALVWDSSNSNLMLYIDGVKVNETALSSSANAAGNLVIGDGFKGLIDELAIYDDDLSPSTIALHHDLGNAGKDYCDESGAGGTSTTKTDFNIRGCTFDDTIGVPAGRCSIDPVGGEFYCDDDKYPWITSNWGLGCTMDAGTSYDIGNNLPFCCPPGKFCKKNETNPKIFRCERRTEQCFDQKNKPDCNDIGCVWLDIEGICVDGVRDYDCSYYRDGPSCAADEWNLGEVGLGTNICGTTIECDDETFSVKDCECIWYETADEGKKCQLNLVGKQMFYDPADGQNVFSCSNAYDRGNCTDGEQLVTWTSTNTSISGFSTVPEDCLEEIGCVGGSITRSCGEPIIKVPFFSLFSWIASLIIIVVILLSDDWFEW